MNEEQINKILKIAKQINEPCHDLVKLVYDEITKSFNATDAAKKIQHLENEVRMLQKQKDDWRSLYYDELYTEEVKENARRKIIAVCLNKTTTRRLICDKGNVLIDKGVVLTENLLRSVPARYLNEIDVDSERIWDDEVADKIDAILSEAKEKLRFANEGSMYE